jgi:ubiquinone/menaquinone biosynthesis C-methylase UbiE
MATEDYAQASYEIWQKMAEGWDRERAWMLSITRPVADWLVGALAPKQGETMLELAAGTGDTGFAVADALGRDGRLIQTDFAPNMIEAARREAERLGLENVEQRVLDAEQMDLDDDSVDGVLCRWGFMLMANPAAALSETARVLRPGGRLAFAVWAEPDRNRWASAPGRALLEHFGTPPPDPEAPGMFALANPDRTHALVEQAGLEVARIEEVELSWTFDDFDSYWGFVMTLAGGCAIALQAVPEDDRTAVRDLAEQMLADLRADDGSYSLPGVTQVTLASA